MSVRNEQHVYDCALKTKDDGSTSKVLKMNVNVLMTMRRTSSGHLCKIYVHDRTTQFTFVVMTLIGESLRNLVTNRKGVHLSMNTAIGVRIQCLRAIEHLHVGYSALRKLRGGTSRNRR